MCGACGGPIAGWTERVAPLTGGGAARRGAALAALLALAPAERARRARAMPWHGGGWRLWDEGGWSFSPSLEAAITHLTRKYGPLVPGRDGAPDPAATPDAGPETRARLPADIPAETVAVWGAAMRASGLVPPGLTVYLPPATAVRLDGHRVEVRTDGPAVTAPALHTRSGAPALAAGLAALAAATPGRPGSHGAE
ncbi:hypothetical protein ACFOVU_23600 [Nocardiopsis sediminis]|uniref:Uncharacterized protein n=1 Tax=Nocardiopsis sediminis TaxID=1778267 RepID=A0ABV8FSW6_9ACTN